MNFDIEDFKQRLDKQRAKGESPALYIQQEVRRAEDNKSGLSEETGEAAPFVSQAINRIDTYIFQLHEMAKEFDRSQFALDQRTYLKDQEMHERIGERLDRLKEQGEANSIIEDPMLREGNPEKEE